MESPDLAIERAKKREAELLAEREAERAKAAVTKASRAEMLVLAARNLEKAAKFKSALENYRRVVKEFGDTPSAKVAAERIKSLDPNAKAESAGKPPAQPSAKAAPIR